MYVPDAILANLKPYAMWTDDCQGKQDFDGPIMSISSRYWPGPDKPRAYSEIVINTGPREEDDGGGTYYVWAEKQFEADTEAEVKAKVEAWVTTEMKRIITKLTL